jgi:hypothetical protein
LTRHGAGKSLMLAEMAPSVAGWPAAKPNTAEATAVTAITPMATLSPLRICWPTNSFSSAGERSQLRMVARAAGAESDPLRNRIVKPAPRHFGTSGNPTSSSGAAEIGAPAFAGVTRILVPQKCRTLLSASLRTVGGYDKPRHAALGLR